MQAFFDGAGHPRSAAAAKRLASGYAGGPLSDIGASVIAEDVRVFHLGESAYKVKLVLVGSHMTADGRIVEEDVELQNEIRDAVAKLLQGAGRGTPVRTDSFVVVATRKKWPLSDKVLFTYRSNVLGSENTLQNHPWEYTFVFELLQ